GVGDVDVALRVERDAAQRVELPGVGAALAPRLDEVAVFVELRDARVARAHRDAVGDVDVALFIPGDARGADEAVARDSRSWRSGRTASAAATARRRLTARRARATSGFSRRPSASFPASPAVPARLARPAPTPAWL